MERGNPAEQYSFEKRHTVEEALRLAEAGEQVEVAVTGRVMRLRGQGGILFADIRDRTGDVQIVGNSETTPELDSLQSSKIGDILGVTGVTGVTRRGAPSVFVTDWRRLASPDIGLPSTLKGFTDPELRARQRHLDMIMNPLSLQRLETRSRMVAKIREFMHEHGFLEVETPILQPEAGGAHARPFTTHHNALGQDMTLRIAPELFLKRLIVGGMERIFEIGKDFRNEGISTRHNPEFTMMEAYAAYQDHNYQMDLTEELVCALAIHLHGTDQITYQGRPVDLSRWERKTMDELVGKAIGSKISIDTRLSRMRKLCETHGVAFDEQDDPGVLLLGLYEKLVESQLWGPIFVTDYPTSVSPLARDHRKRPGYTERFEGIVAGRELCNGYTELNNARIQHERFLAQALLSERGDEEAMPVDSDYVRALRAAMPPTAGLGIGIDRLAMLMTDAASIRDVIAFPTLRREIVPMQY